MNKLFPRVIGTLPNYNSDYDVGFAPWARLIRRHILIDSKISFISERKYIYEDLLFTLDLFPHLNCVMLVNEPLYHYCENSSSLTTTFKKDKFKRICQMVDYIYSDDKYNMILSEKNVKLRFDRTILSYLRLCVIQMNGQSINYFKEISNSKICRSILKEYPIYKLPLKQKIFAFCLKYKLNYILLLIVKIYNRRMC